MARNSPIVSMTEIATAAIASAMTTPYAASQCAPPSQARTLIAGAASASDIAAIPTAIVAMRTANSRSALADDDRIRSRSPRA